MQKSIGGLVVAIAAAVLAACGGDSAGPQTGRCSHVSPAMLSLAIGAYTTVSANADSGCVSFPANASATDTAEYLVLAQSAAGTPGATNSFVLKSANLFPAPTATASRGSAPVQASMSRTFDHMLRSVAARRSYPTSPKPSFNIAGPQSPNAGPPTAGSLRTFKVCATATCTTFNSITAAAQSVGAHIAVYVDTLAPAGGLNAADLDTLKTLFDTRLYGVDTVAFGRESDLDANGVVIVLMTGAVNALAPKASCATDGFVAGFFYPGDLDPAFAAQFNNGEIFYTIVADTAGALSCAHTRAEVKAVTPTTFLHEFQHMINFAQHVVVRGTAAEDDWVDEGLSKLAEELGGRTFLPGDRASFSQYSIDDVFDAYQYLQAPDTHFLVTTTDESQPDVGAGWLFMRYLADQYGAGITRSLVQTTRTGAANVAAVTGQSFPTLVERWSLANWVSDLPGLTPAPELKYTSWTFRSTFSSLHSQDAADFPLAFPLVPTQTPGDSVSLSGTLHAGSATYHRILQAPRASAFTVQLSANGAAPPSPAVAAQLTVIRLR